MDVLKVGMVGAGFVAAFHARAIQQVRGLDIAGVTSRTTANAEALAQFVRAHNLGAGIVHGSITEMAPHVDAIAI